MSEQWTRIGFIPPDAGLPSSSSALSPEPLVSPLDPNPFLGPHKKFFKLRKKKKIVKKKKVPPQEMQEKTQPQKQEADHEMGFLQQQEIPPSFVGAERRHSFEDADEDAKS